MLDYLALGVNIDHVATLRQARGTTYPQPIDAALIAERAGADSITLHLREDRRHIQEQDVYLIRDACQTPLNFECAVTDAMLAFACHIKPENCCLVPEKREERTTEGGLDVLRQQSLIKQACQRLQSAGILVSLFIEATHAQIDAAVACGADKIEIHTGAYADATDARQQAEVLQQITEAARYAKSLGLIVNAGHGLHYHNTLPIARIAELSELNIGHAIIARAVMTGMHEAVAGMRALMDKGRCDD